MRLTASRNFGTAFDCVIPWGTITLEWALHHGCMRALIRSWTVQLGPLLMLPEIEKSSDLSSSEMEDSGAVRLALQAEATARKESLASHALKSFITGAGSLVQAPVSDHVASNAADWIIGAAKF